MATPQFNCLSFNGINNYLDCGKIDLSTFSNHEFTIEAWINPIRGLDVVDILSFSSDTIPAMRMGLDSATSIRLHSLLFLTNIQNLWNTPSLTISYGRWQHCACVYGDHYNGTHKYVEIYIDGVCQYDCLIHPTNLVNTPFPSGMHDITIGCSAKNGVPSFFNGKISEVRVWNKVRTLEEIKSTKDQRLLGIESGLVAYWPLYSSDSNQVTIKDQAGTFDATITGASWQLDNLLLPDPLSGNQTSPTPATVPPVGQPEITSQQTPNLPNGGHDPISSLDQHDWRQKIITEANHATIDKVLELKDSTFSEFNLLKTVTDTLFKVVRIRDVHVELVNGSELEKIESGAAKPDTVGKGKTKRPAFDKKFSIKKGGGVKISGKTDLLGLKSAEVALEFAINDKKEKDALIKIKTTSSEGQDISKILGGILAREITDVLSVLDTTEILNPSFAFSTSSVSDDDEPFDVGVSEGFNFYGQLNLSKFKTDFNPANIGLGEMLGWVAQIFGIEKITAHLCLNKTSTGIHFELNAIIEQDISFSAGSHLEIVYQGVVISLSVGGSPPLPKISIQSSMLLTSKIIGADNLALTGEISLNPKTIGGAFSFQNETNPYHPFNFSLVSVKDMAVEIGGSYIKPYIDNFGFGTEDLKIGDVKGSLAVKLDTNGYDNFVFNIGVEEISLLQLGTAFSPATFIAYQALPNETTNPLETLINCKVLDLKMSIVPVATTIGQLNFDKEGFNAEGKLSLWGWVAMMEAHISNKEFDVSAQIDPFQLTTGGFDLVKVAGAGNNQKPNFKLKLGQEITPEFEMSLSVTILEVRQDVYVYAGKDGLKFRFEVVNLLFNASLESTLISSSYSGKGNFEFGINEKINLGILGEINLNVEANLALTIQIDHTFFLSLTGELTFMGMAVGISFQPETVIHNFEDLPSALIAYLKMNGQKIFGVVFATLSEWANAVLNRVITFSGSVAQVAKEGFNLSMEAISEIIEASRLLGETPAQITKGLKDFYGLSLDQIVSALKLAEYSIEEVVDGIKEAYHLSDKAVTDILRNAGYTTSEIIKVLESSFRLTWAEIASLLNAANFPVDQVAKGLKSAFDISEKQVTDVLKEAGHSVETITKALKSGLNISKTLAANTLMAANYPVDQVASGIKAAYNLGETAVVETLTKVGYFPDEVAKALQKTYGTSAEGVASVLKAAGYTVAEVTTALDWGLNLSENSINTVLEGAGYAFEEIQDVLKPLNPINWLPGPVQSFVSNISNWNPF